ncbi:hypothetical protein LIER_14174 [Lithospermum erythrorhizon]|uniref:SBP-type domain-containing protein n=1 Tax=Lithospermum erythrorhizon TaxID=34254 RepID=A0AAV3Q3E6_LITER
MSEGKAVGKRVMEWDLNYWKWDGDLFTATPLDPLPSDCSKSKQFLPVGSEISLVNSALCDENVKRELEKRRRVVVDGDDDLNYEDGSLSLEIGGKVYPVDEGKINNVKKSKTCGGSSNGVVCQVEGCRADLSLARDYHRRHKVCDVHSKATSALVGAVMQRFCQQCSRFHPLQEFDEVRRSCRKRLAGHNKRRRKTHPENAITGSPQNDEQGSNYLLASLLRILSNIHLNNSDQSKVHDLLSHLMKNLANSTGPGNEENLTGAGSQSLLFAGASTETRTKELVSDEHHAAASTSEMREKNELMDGVRNINLQNPSAPLLNIGVGITGAAPYTEEGRTELNYIDLNNACDDHQDCMENLKSDTLSTRGKVSSTTSIQLCRDPQKSNTYQKSENSTSMSLQSPYSSSGEAQSRTERIVFKLFGKDPKDFPHVLRNQILDWLSRSPTEIESYIRPGCIVLTIYLRMDKSIWEELSSDMTSHLRRLLNSSTHSFWKTGWIYTRVQQSVAFIYDGQVVLETSLSHASHRSYRILSIRPIAVPPSETVQFSVRGLNFSQSRTRLLCAIEGKYLLQENYNESVGAASLIEHNLIQSLSFRCTIPNISGRGFIEVEDHSLSNTFFPFIVAENDVCLEIRSLESLIEVEGNIEFQDDKSLDAKTQALNFINEMGWLLHKNQAKLGLEHSPHTDIHFDLFPFERFKWLVYFSLDREWCAVVSKLLSILFNETVDAGQHSSVELALLEIGLLHRAVQQKSRPMVEFLLRFQQNGVVKDSGTKQKQYKGEDYYLFRPDATGPGGLTPLHIAASCDGSLDVLDALVDDPGMVSIKAWNTVRDSTGRTPDDYASLHGYYLYVNLVKEKIEQKYGDGHVVLDISAGLEDNSEQKLSRDHLLVKTASFHIQKGAEHPYLRHCKQCEQKMPCGSTRRTSLIMYKPAMLSMVAIAAICVCVALLFKSSPEVYDFRQFRWENLKYGPM